VKTNDIPCFYETNESLSSATINVNIAYIESLNSLCVGVDVLAGEDMHTIYIPHTSISHLIQGLSSSYFSIQESIEQMEDEDGK
jgi:hypothetical protein